jgi:predicted GIY-YIG superfamily endonuclease
MIAILIGLMAALLVDAVRQERKMKHWLNQRKTGLDSEG